MSFQREIFPGSEDCTALPQNLIHRSEPRLSRLIAVVSSNNIPDPERIPVSEYPIGGGTALQEGEKSDNLLWLMDGRQLDGEDSGHVEGIEPIDREVADWMSRNDFIDSYSRVMEQKLAETIQFQEEFSRSVEYQVSKGAVYAGAGMMVLFGGGMTIDHMNDNLHFPGTDSFALPDLLSTDTVYAQSGTIGGKELGLRANNPPSSNAPSLIWNAGNMQSNYAVLRVGMTSGNRDILPPGSLTASSTSYQLDQMGVGAEPTCYMLLVLGSNGALIANSDVACIASTKALLNPPGKFTVKAIDGNPAFNFAWEQSPFQHIIYDPITGILAPVPDGQVSVNVPANGFTCRMVGSLQNGNLVGISDLLCGLKASNYPPDIIVSPSPTKTPTLLIPTATMTPSLTAILTATPSRTATPTAVLGPAQIIYDIGPGVPNAEVDVIKAGVTLAQNELRSNYGGDILRPLGNPMTVKIVATGLGNQEPGGGGACCTGLDETGGRPFFDVMHQSWIGQSRTSHEVIVAHEYIHAWYNSLGCISLHNQPVYDWMNEGVAEYLGHQSLVIAGEVSDQVARYQNYVSAKGSGELNNALSQLEGPGGIPVWPGNIGYLAIEQLKSQAPNGALSIRNFCELISSGSTVDQAMQNAFGRDKSSFYNFFPSYIQNLSISPVFLEVIRRMPQGAGIPSNGVQYELGFAAYGYEDIPSNQQFAAWILPPEICGWGSNEIGKVYISLCAQSGVYPITLHLPDGRKGQIDIAHTS